LPVFTFSDGSSLGPFAAIRVPSSDVWLPRSRRAFHRLPGLTDRNPRVHLAGGGCTPALRWAQWVRHQSRLSRKVGPMSPTISTASGALETEVATALVGADIVVALAVLQLNSTARARMPRSW